MKTKTTLTFIIVALCLIAYSFFAIRKETGLEFAISIDLNKPFEIEWPCEVSIIGDRGEKGLRIAPKVGRGWTGEVGGKASYRFFIPKDGRYHIWAYCLWFDECTNAVFAKIDDQDKAIIGNDPVYGKWHWVRGFDVTLKKGTHSILLSNHSDHIAVQKIIFSNSSTAGPQQIGLVFSDVFYDGFDGCDRGNFASWQQVSGSWYVRNPDSATNLIENVLIGQSKEKAFIAFENSDWQDYSMDISIKVLPLDSKSGVVAVCFGLTDTNSFYQLGIQPVPRSKTAKIAVFDKNSKIISEFKVAFEIDKWQQIQIALKHKHAEIRVAENSPVKIKIGQKIIGGIGLMLKGQITAYFDNIHIRKITHKNNPEQ